MANEKNEATLEHLLVYSPLRLKGLDLDSWAEYQGSQDPTIKPLLEPKPSKSGDTQTQKTSSGKPEMIYRIWGGNDLIVVEVKKSLLNHSSKSIPVGELKSIKGLKPKDYAEDGVIHYINGLKRQFNCIGLAISGTGIKDRVISTFRVKAGGVIEKTSSDSFLTEGEYSALITELYTPTAEEVDILKFAATLHNYLRDKLELSEHEKPLLISAILLALEDKAFIRSFPNYAIEDAFTEMISAIKKVLAKGGSSKTKIQSDKIDLIIAQYLAIQSPVIQLHLHELITMIMRNICTQGLKATSFDLIGNFYAEFLKYSGGDQKGLGIVLTPRHITSLFVKLGKIDKDTTVVDTCTGTGSFLISSMVSMLKSTKIQDEIDIIKQNKLIGIELNPKMYTLACANMLLRGDGKANMFNCSLFDLTEDAKNRILELKPDVGMLNPPYSKKDSDKHELAFIYETLQLVKKNGLVIAIVPVSCAIGDIELTIHYKKKILEKHSLISVMTMPDDLFYPVKAHTCIMVFEAGVAHDSIKETWFANWRKDGFTKRKGVRVGNNEWHDYTDNAGNSIKGIESIWCEQYTKRKEVSDISLLKSVTATDEWLFEAYTSIDYNSISISDFDKCVKHLAMHKLSLKYNSNGPIATDLWASFKISEIFKVQRGGSEPLSVLETLDGCTPVVSAASENNGISCMTNNNPTFPKVPCLTVSNNGSAIGTTFVQERPFIATGDATILTPLDAKLFSVEAGLFIATIITKDCEPKYSYGRKLDDTSLADTSIKLPVKIRNSKRTKKAANTVKTVSDIDWDYMKSYILQLQQKYI